jgi:hypothetical protein
MTTFSNDISNPRTAALVDLVAFGESPTTAGQLIADAEASMGRTMSGDYGMVAYDDEPPYRGVGNSPYYVARMADVRR